MDAGRQLAEKIQPLAILVTCCHRTIGGTGKLFELPFDRYRNTRVRSEKYEDTIKVNLVFELKGHNIIDIDLICHVRQ